MIIKPQVADLKIIGFSLGKIISGLGFTMFIPFFIGLVCYKETTPALDFLFSAELTLFIGYLLSSFCKTNKELKMIHGMVVVSLAWLVAMLVSAIPLYLSGHYKYFLDACFETMSGFTTTGLTLVQDLDHLSYAHNLWRHLGPFIGGQGMAIIALALLVKGFSGNLSMYLAEGRDEKILPNIINTSRFIWMISIIYLTIGTLALGLVGLQIGLKPGNAFFHGACIFMAGFDTAGFSPQTQNILYYHSAFFEIVTIIFMIVGSFNFNLHFQLWKGNFSEIRKNIETKIFFISIMLTFYIVTLGLLKNGTYAEPLILFRKGFFQVVSAHSTTGYMTVYAQQFITEWGELALLGLIVAMGLGGCACSTAGGIKMLRVGVFVTALKQDIKAMLVPAQAILTEKFHHIKTIFIEDKLVRAALIITLIYITSYILGAFIGVFCGYPFLNSLFESTSAAGNVGFSCGITDVSMPTLLKVTYIVQMWTGRLEFMSVFALLGFIATFFVGRK